MAADVDQPLHPARSTRVLIVEDDADSREVLACLVGVRQGVVVDTAANGQDGLALARAMRPDVILADLVLPMRSGGDMIRELKAQPETKRIPIIAVTGLPSDDAIRAGCDGYVRKPCRPEDLLGEIRRVLATPAR